MTDMSAFSACVASSLLYCTTTGMSLRPRSRTARPPLLFSGMYPPGMIQWVCSLASAVYRVNAAGTPPSTVSMQPVVFADFDDAKNAIASAMSRG